MYNLACAYARSGQKPQALDFLSKAISSNLPGAVSMNDDPDLASLRDDQVFKDLVLAHEKRTKPCLFAPESRQFDFWVGDWAVFNPQGQRAGTSRIESFAVGCGLLENWTSAGGAGGGKSINFYDPGDRKWHQYWMGADGRPQRYAGTFADGAMRYVGDPVTVNGKTTLSRLTFFNVDPDTVRQLAEQSTDGGRTWTVVYDLKYVRQKGGA